MLKKFHTKFNRGGKLSLFGFLLGMGSLVLIHEGHELSAKSPRVISLPNRQMLLSPDEYPIVSIPLGGPVAARVSEVSGLAWYGNYLILLPQYPERLKNRIFAWRKQTFLHF